MFGKTVLEYVRFERAVLIALVAVGVVRLATSLAGVPEGTVRIFSMTVVTLAGALWVGIAVAGRHFGSYRHLLPLLFFQSVVLHGITILGIAIAGVGGRPHVFTAPEYSNLPNYAPHAIGHVAGMFVWPLALWPLAALALWITRTIRGGSSARAGA